MELFRIAGGSLFIMKNFSPQIVSLFVAKDVFFLFRSFLCFRTDKGEATAHHLPRASLSARPITMAMPPRNPSVLDAVQSVLSTIRKQEQQSLQVLDKSALSIEEWLKSVIEVGRPRSQCTTHHVKEIGGN